MFRRVAILGTLITIVVTAVVLFAVTVPIQRAVTEDVRERVDRAARLCEQRLRLDAADLIALVESVAAEKEFVDLLAPEVPEAERRVRAASAVDGHNERLALRGAKADFAAVVDVQGRVLARNLDPTAMYGEQLEKLFPSVKLALQGKASKDIVNFEQKMYRVGAAPVRGADGNVAGALVLAHVVTARSARAYGDQFGTEVAYFLDGRIHASSFVVEGTETEDGEAAENVERVQAVNRHLFGDEGLAAKVLDTGAPSDLVAMTVQRDLYQARIGTIPDSATNKSSGYLVLASVTEALRPFRVTQRGILALGLAALLLLLGAAYAVERYYLRGLDKVELGVAEIISGNMEHTFEAFEKEFEGLENALNVMLARLLGRPEPGADEDAEPSPEHVVITEPGGSAEETARLGREPEDAYYRRVFTEYVQSRQALGEAVDGLTPESLVQKLRANEAMLRAKHECSAVRFIVEQRDGRTTLRPVLIV